MAPEKNMNNSDHDLLITLVETVKNNHTAVLDRIEGVKNDVKEIKEGTNVRLTDHEVRIKNLERMKEEITNLNLIALVKEDNQWINQYKVTYKTIIGLSIFLSSSVSFILGVVASLLQLFKKL